MTRRTLLLALLLTTSRLGVAAAQPATGPAGHWEGAIEVPGQSLGDRSGSGAQG